MPEQDSSSNSTRLGRRMAEKTGIEHVVQDIAPTLEAIGLLNARCRHQGGWRARRVGMNKIVIASCVSCKLHFFKLVVQSPDGKMREYRLTPKEYLEIVAATDYKQRIRMTLEYFPCRAASTVPSSVSCTGYDQGLFVKNGAGSADVKPIAHL
jgi:NAD+ synthase